VPKYKIRSMRGQGTDNRRLVYRLDKVKGTADSLIADDWCLDLTKVQAVMSECNKTKFKDKNIKKKLAFFGP